MSRLRHGEDFLGLSDAFLASGASHVVSSLWKVDDNATKELLVNFYRHFAKGEDVPTSLYKAQIQLINGKYSDPKYWAAFVSFGK